MEVEMINPTPGHLYVNPTIRFETRIEHKEAKEAILQVTGWIKSKDDIYLSPLTESSEPGQRTDELHARGTLHERQNTTNLHHLILTTQLNQKTLKYIENERTKNKKKDVILKIELNISFLQSNARISHVFMLDSHPFNLPNKTITNNAGREVKFSIMANAYDREYSTDLNNGWILSGNGGPSFLSVKNEKIIYPVTIPSSDWINDYAPLFGLGNYSIIEIPTGSETINEAWSYVKKADVAYMNWDSKSIYANCRECGSLLDIKMEERFGKSSFMYEERWGRSYRLFKRVSSLNLHLEEKISEYSEENVEINKPDAEYLIIVTKALVNFAQELLSD